MQTVAAAVVCPLTAVERASFCLHFGVLPPRLSPQLAQKPPAGMRTASCWQFQQRNVGHALVVQSNSRCRGSALGPKMSSTDKTSIEIAPLVDPVYARTLAIICCRSFYGEHTPKDSINIFASLQRALLFEEIVGDLSRRLVRYQSMSRTSDLGCGRVLTAVDEEGTLVGFLDLSLTLFDTVADEFLVSEGPGLTLPRPGMERRAYVANVAVSKEARRKGVAEKLMREAEKLALKWADCKDLWLEVSKSNLAAVNLYKKLGYEVKQLDPESKEVVRGPLGYSMEISPRLRFAKNLDRGAGAGGQEAQAS